VTDPAMPDEMVWTGASLRRVARAIVGVRGWHTERFSPAVFATSSDIFRLADSHVAGRAAQMLGPGPVAKVLCLPGLPASGTLRKKALELLMERGINGVILFRTMLLELAAYVDINRNYDRSDLLQVIRILKNYDLLKDAQMELFKRRQGKPQKNKDRQARGEA
jgi:hypothetical protein